MTPVSATEARTTLPALLDRVSAGEEVTITRHGEAIAVLVRPDALRVRRAERAFVVAGQIIELLNTDQDAATGDDPGLSVDAAEELVALIRADRDGRR